MCRGGSGYPAISARSASAAGCAGLGTTALGWTLCLVLLACGGYWLARNKPWRGERGGPGGEGPAQPAAEAERAEMAGYPDPPRHTERV